MGLCEGKSECARALVRACVRVCLGVWASSAPKSAGVRGAQYYVYIYIIHIILYIYPGCTILYVYIIFIILYILLYYIYM